MLKIVKERNKLISYLNEAFKLSAGVERLVFFAFLFLLLSHISGCLWVLIAKIHSQEYESWPMRYGYQDESNFNVIELI